MVNQVKKKRKKKKNQILTKNGLEYFHIYSKDRNFEFETSNVASRDSWVRKLQNCSVTTISPMTQQHSQVVKKHIFGQVIVNEVSKNKNTKKCKKFWRENHALRKLD